MLFYANCATGRIFRTIMRIKTVPRHLPGRNSIQGFTRAKDTAMSANFVSTKKLEGDVTVRVKTVNFTTYEDIVQEMNPIKKQNEIKIELEKHLSEIKVEPIDRLIKGELIESDAGPPEDIEKFKDTYLYQIMTDPKFVENIKREKHNSKNCCPYCKKEFNNELDVKKHLMSIQTTNESNRLTCCACGKSFAQKRYLRYHQRSHSERNKYACNICTRKYSRHDNLTRHNIFHTNPNKFPCNSCERTFARKDLLNKHLKCHENKYKFHCDICQKYFKGAVTLENHRKLLHSSTDAAS